MSREGELLYGYVAKLLKGLTSWYALFFYIGVLFFLKSYVSLDPDFGWHIALGKYILLHGIAYKDPFSYSMPSYPFVDHEWFTNIMMGILYQHIGKVGMAIMWTFFALLALYTSVLLIPKKQKLFGKLFFLLSGISLLMYFGIRTQVISWVFSMLLLVLLTSKQKFIQILGSAMLMLFWVNMHGSFPLGLLIIAVGAFIHKQKNLWVLFFVSCAVTFVNPYGMQLWKEVWNQLSDSSLRFAIQEWLPSIIFPTFLSLWLCIGIVVGAGISVWKKLSRQAVVLFIIFVLLGASSMRHMPFALLLAIPLGAQAFSLLLEKSRAIPFGKKRFLVSYAVFVAFSVLVICVQLYITHFTNFMSEEMYYPQKEVAYLIEHPFSGNLFSIYNWGGYLIWKYPQKKVFIDGRMPSWRWHAPGGESDNAFAELNAVTAGKEQFSYFVQKYHIAMLLLPKGKPQSSAEKHFLQEIKKTGFVSVFTGTVGVVYKKLPVI